MRLIMSVLKLDNDCNRSTITGQYEIDLVESFPNSRNQSAWIFLNTKSNQQTDGRIARTCCPISTDDNLIQERKFRKKTT